MKQLFLFTICATVFGFTKAQNNIGIGTQTPHVSSMLDVSSNTKGLLAPRMTTAQRTAIASPAKGLLVYDTDVNSLFHYNGSTWANLATGGGGFSLPFTASVDLNTNVFQITNAGNGAALTGITNNEFGFGVSGIANSGYGYGIYGYANDVNSIGVYGNSNVGTAVKAQSVSGVGMEAKSTHNSAITASIASGANSFPVINASHAGFGSAVSGFSQSGTGIMGSTNSDNFLHAGVQGTNYTASGYGVLGVANADQSTGVRGNSTNGTGVGGNSSLGMAVHGNSTNGTGVFGQSLGSGTALKGQSANGFGLDVSGKVKISGGNTSPATGAVLTSIDVSGNAVWKPQQIAFKAFGTHSSFITVPMSSASRKMHFASEQYDYGNNFVPTTSGSPSAEMSTFIAPISGLYHFDVGINVTLDDTYDDFRDVNAYVIVKRNNVDFTILTISTQCCNANLGYQVSLYGSIDQKLLPGDAVRVQIYQWNDDDATAKQPNTIDNYFSGHLVFAD